MKYFVEDKTGLTKDQAIAYAKKLYNNGQRDIYIGNIKYSNGKKVYNALPLYFYL